MFVSCWMKVFSFILLPFYEILIDVLRYFWINLNIFRLNTFYSNYLTVSHAFFFKPSHTMIHIVYSFQTTLTAYFLSEFFIWINIQSWNNIFHCQIKKPSEISSTLFNKKLCVNIDPDVFQIFSSNRNTQTFYICMCKMFAFSFKIRQIYRSI